MKPIYGLVCFLPDQMKIIDKFCFGSCGKVIVGGLTDDLVGGLLVCRIPKEKCPCFEKEMEEPYGEVMGDPVYIRKLKEIL